MPLFFSGDLIDANNRNKALYIPATVAFNPLTQVTPLHAVWAGDPAWTNPGDGNAVDSWRNVSGGGDPANTGTNRPTYRASTSTFNNRPTVAFVAASSQSLSFDIANVSQTFKLVAVAKTNSLAAARRIVGSGVAAAGGMGHNGSSAWTISYGTNLAGGTASTTTAHCFRGTAAGASSQVWVDEASVVSGSANTNQTTRFTVGAGDASGVFSNFWDGDIAFVGIYDSATTDASLSQLCVDLKTHYGTP